MRHVVLCAVLCLSAFVAWEIQGVMFQLAKEKFGDEVQTNLHELGQFSAREALKTAGPYLVSKSQPNLVDRNVRTAEFVSWADEVYDLEKPAVEWKSPNGLMSELVKHYMFGLARRARPYGKILESEAIVIARGNDDFNHVLKIEKLLLDIQEIQIQIPNAGSWKKLDIIREKFEAIKESLKQKLGGVHECHDLKLPKVSIPRHRIRVASC